MSKVMGDPITRRLLRWYRANRRDLPWRRTHDPYSIWISEIMLQQTRVEAVIPYYEKFLGRYPDVFSLAKVPVDDVVTAWSGLGYYKRARSLHSAARELVSRYNGQLPKEYKEITSLPGIGAYTAGAILSIGYDKRVPVLDGNVIRLLTRLFEIHGDPGETKNKKRLWKLASTLLPKKHIGDFNQALMELPALLCTPRSPRCQECPLEDLCVARKKGIQGSLPEKKKKAPSRPVELCFTCIQQNGRVLLVRRKKSPMKGMWEFPSRKVRGASFVGSVRHSIMNQRIRAHYFLVRAKNGKKVQGRWFAPRKFSSIPLTTLTRKGMALIEL